MLHPDRKPSRSIAAGRGRSRPTRDPFRERTSPDRSQNLPGKKTALRSAKRSNNSRPISPENSKASILQLAPEGTPFQLEVWRRLCDIPYGETISYGELAGRIGNPKASRAVGLANGSNPIPIVIPCHRVIGSNGKLTGYGGGLPIKEKLLALERRQLRLL